MSLNGKQATLVVVEQQSLFSELFEQGFDLCVLEFDDLLPALVRDAAETGQQEVPWLQDRGQICLRRMKSSREMQ